MNLKEMLAERIATGLKRKSITSCSRWAENYRFIKGIPWRFRRHPWLREMHDCDSNLVVGQKAAQMGFTEWALNTCFYEIDIHGHDVLYVLPSKDDASDFSSGRFDPALESSPHLKNLFSDVSNVGHKRAGQSNLYVRGSRSRSKLKSIPTGVIIFDELDEMTQENIPLARERASGQDRKLELMISTPTFDEMGINSYFQKTTQEEFFFKCPGCSRLINLDFPGCLVITADRVEDPGIKNSHLICTQCNKILHHHDKPEWLSTGRFVPQFSDRDGRGFSVNQFYSSAEACSPPEMAKAYLLSLYDPSAEQEFFNSKLGKTHVVKGAQVLDTEIQSCYGSYRNGSRPQSPIVTMGVDVGKRLHVCIEEWTLPSVVTSTLNELSTCRLLLATTVNEFEELAPLLFDYNVKGCVIDKQPETRKAYEFACKYWGMVKLCIYVRGISSRQVSMSAEEEQVITVDRTSWLDLSLSRYRNNTIKIPEDISEEYKKHIKEPKRLYKKDQDGNQVGYYQSVGADHYAHARNYSEIALLIAASISQSQDIGGIY